MSVIADVFLRQLDQVIDLWRVLAAVGSRMAWPEIDAGLAGRAKGLPVSW